MKWISLFRFFFLAFFPIISLAFPAVNGIKTAPQPLTCIKTTFQVSSEWWKKVTLTLQNTCGTPVNLKNTTITFKNNNNLNTNIWGSFDSLSYPDVLKLSSQPTTQGYLSTIYFHIPDGSWAQSILPNNGIIQLMWGSETADIDRASAVVFVGDTPLPLTGSINLVNLTAKPQDVTQEFAIVNILLNGELVKTFQPIAIAEVPWLGSKVISGLNRGTYKIEALNVNGSQYTYRAIINPDTVTVAAGQTVTREIRYQPLLNEEGKIRVSVTKPIQLNGYTMNPVIKLTAPNGASLTRSISWGTTTLIGELVNNTLYSLSTPVIEFNNSRCTGVFNPDTLESSSSESPPTSVLTYTCVTINQVSVNVKVTGLPSSVSSINVIFTPNNDSLPITRTIGLNNGSGNTIVSLAQNVVYNVSSTAIPGFIASYQPQPLTAIQSATETITYSSTPTPDGTGRTIGYLPGWKTPPPAADLANAGYTHILVAFGVFSNNQAGVITPAFETVSQSYISSLKNVGIKVLLSLGGASTSLPDTTVDFHQVLSLASSPTIFQHTFVQSVKNLVTQYGFDGVDIDIEHGLGVDGTMSSPTGDVAVLANIINQLHSELPNLLITLSPQTANISATSGFDQTWGNYAALIMKTHDALTWVGVQLYNSGCMFGIDQVCYDPNNVTSPDFSVAMAVDMLESWPAQINGQPTGFQPYIGSLRPDQVVLGYPSPNGQGDSDGRPVTPVNTIKRAIECLKTAIPSPTSCASYVPPKAYGLIGGVFNWEVTYDMQNQFRFAKDLKTCVTTGICS